MEISFMQLYMQFYNQPKCCRATFLATRGYRANFPMTWGGLFARLEIYEPTKNVAGLPSLQLEVVGLTSLWPEAGFGLSQIMGKLRILDLV